MNTMILRSLRTISLYWPIRQTSTISRVSRIQKSIYASNSSTSSPLYQNSPLQIRYVSATSSLSAKTPATATSSAQPPSTSKVNGPISTLPAPLDLPTRAPSQSAPAFYISLGKAFLQFYKTGVKNIYSNYKTSSTLRSTLPASTSLYKTALSGTLSRHDFQLLLRSTHDIKRVPIFALVFMICGEFTPLIVIALSNVVPWPCRIPRQIGNDRKKLENRRSISFRNLTMEPPKEAGTKELQRMQLLHINWSLGLSSRMWDWLGGKLPGLPTGLLRRKLEKRLQYLEADDFLIGKCGGVKEMSFEEVKMACVERGIDVLGRREEGLKGDLSAWLKSREEVPVERLLLTRPSVWPVKAKSQEKNSVEREEREKPGDS